MNIEHPVFTAGVNQSFIYENGNAQYWPVDQYYIEGERHTNFLGKDICKEHHTLTTIVNGLIQCGFVLETIEEVLPDMETIVANGWQDELKRPMMLLIKAVKYEYGKY